jgi:hypothetical protein
MSRNSYDSWCYGHLRQKDPAVNYTKFNIMMLIFSI